MTIEVFVQGIPYGKNKSRGDRGAPIKWSEAVRQQAAKLTPITGPCFLQVEFVLPSNKYPTDLPFGPDLDNLLKRLLDALQPKPLENDSFILKLEASKRMASASEITGARLAFSEGVMA